MRIRAIVKIYGKSVETVKVFRTDEQALEYLRNETDDASIKTIDDFSRWIGCTGRPVTFRWFEPDLPDGPLPIATGGQDD